MTPAVDRYNSARKAVSWNGTLCLDYANEQQLTLKACDGTSTQTFTYSDTTKTLKTPGNQCLDIWDWAGPRVDIFSCNGGVNQQFTFDADGTVVSGSDAGHPARCLAAVVGTPTSGVLQLWAKPMLNVGCMSAHTALWLGFIYEGIGCNEETVFPVGETDA